MQMNCLSSFFCVLLIWRCVRVWFMVIVLKTIERNSSVGSNPTGAAVTSKLPSRGVTVLTKTYKNVPKRMLICWPHRGRVWWECLRIGL